MENHTKPANLIEILSKFDGLKNIDVKTLQWIVDHAEYKFYPEGSYFFKAGDSVDVMQFILQGRYVLKIPQGNGMTDAGVFEKGLIAGALPFSRVQTAKAYGLILDDIYTLELHRSHFRELVCQDYDLTQSLVAAMSDRIRNFTYQRTQNEKLLALGKLSAGLAHELNNPASAMVRSADDLYKRIHTTPERFKSVMNLQITPEQTDEINAILFGKIENPTEQNLTLLETEEKKDEILDWLEDHDIENGDDIAETFVEFDLDPDDLDEVVSILAGKAVEPIIWWIESTLSLELLVNEIRDSAGRISELVSSVKRYSHMDRGGSQEEMDVRKGVVNTLIMLKHKIKQKSIEVIKEFATDIPMIPANPGELNQIWTNIIDNAIDAMDEGGTLKVKIRPDGPYINVTISDTGHGIPEDVLPNIFDPFYTTKAVGEGTGVGLDVVNRIVTRHKGTIKVESEPGNTEFQICFPKTKS